MWCGNGFIDEWSQSLHWIAENVKEVGTLLKKIYTQML